MRARPRLTWRGLRPCTPDGLPVIGAHRRAPRVVFATGHGMLGVTLGPIAVAPFAIDRHPVTVGRYAEFVAAPGYRTVAERRGYYALGSGQKSTALVMRLDLL